MELELTIIMLYAKPYSITEGNITNAGITVQYIISDNLDPRRNDTEHGIRVTKGSLKMSEDATIEKCPGLYKGTFTMNTGADGKASLKLQKVKYISDLEGEF